MTGHLDYLLEEICSGLEIYFTARQGGQYLKTAFLLCDDYTELISKLYLLSRNPKWSDKARNGAFKKYPEVLAEVVKHYEKAQPAVLASVRRITDNMAQRRKRRNDFFHSTKLLDLNVQRRNCVDAYCDLLDYGRFLWGDFWTRSVRSCRQLETLEVLLLLERESFRNETIWVQVNELLKRWPRRNKDSPVGKQGTQYAEYPEDLHLRLCITWGGEALREKLKAMLKSRS